MNRPGNPPVEVGALVQLLRSADLLLDVVGSEDRVVQGVAQDSREVKAGDVFVAWKGTTSDAHDYVAGAATRGAVAAVVERVVEGVAIPQLVVSDGRKAAALVADFVFGHPARDFRCIAVTGTNGKTTTALLLRHLLAADASAAAVGTLGVVGPDGRIHPAAGALTTPGPVELSRTLSDLRRDGVKWLVLEASSHALDQRRLDALDFEVAVFTNLSLDHLDYHGTFSAYRDAKLRLIELVKVDGQVVVNAAEPAWSRVELSRMVRYGVGILADVVAEDVVCDAGGSEFSVRWGEERARARLPLPGRFNVENALAAVVAAVTVGLPFEVAVARLATAPQVPGRMEVLRRDPFTVIIDFAHTPAALENLLTVVRPLTDGQLRVLFGAGGDRDRTKRMPMAEAVARHADRVWATSDNPRTERPEAILDDLEPGLAGADHVREVDRVRAIHGIIAEAAPGDVVVLAGKGHETYQVVGTERRPLDERVIVAEALAARGLV